MVLDTLVTILGGENGYGKSTFLEALAIAVGLVVVGGEDLAHARALDRVRELAAALKAQFFIATHSPLLMAYRGAARYKLRPCPGSTHGL